MITHRTTGLLAGLLWLALWPGAARGQSAELQEAYDLFELLYDKDYYEHGASRVEEGRGGGRLAKSRSVGDLPPRTGHSA